MYNNEKEHGLMWSLITLGLMGGAVCGLSGLGNFKSPSSVSNASYAVSVESSQAYNSFSLMNGQTNGQVNDWPNSFPGTVGPMGGPMDDAVVQKDDSPGYRLVMTTIRDELRQGRPTYALKLLEADPMAARLKNSEFDRIKAHIAQSYLIEGKVARAEFVAAQAVFRSPHHAPLAAWVAGQAAWRQKNYPLAAQMFEVTYNAPKISPWLKSGAAYWAGRSVLRQGDRETAKAWQEKAANYPRTFYGMVALKSLGRSVNFNWSLPSIPTQNFKSLESLSQNQSVQRALSLSAQGNQKDAIQALHQSGYMKTAQKRRELLSYLMQERNPSLILYVARLTKDPHGQYYDLALYPESPWEPKAGYEIDKAVIHALIRQESRFNPHATSTTGAKGLMQIMPATAKHISNVEESSLINPHTNIEVGQKYVSRLMDLPEVNHDLLRMAVAYNAGPGNLARWKKEFQLDDDPLLFIENIPWAETRSFVEKVMVNYWVYRLRMGEDTPSLDAIAALDRATDPSATQMASLTPPVEPQEYAELRTIETAGVK